MIEVTRNIFYEDIEELLKQDIEQMDDDVFERLRSQGLVIEESGLFVKEGKLYSGGAPKRHTTPFGDKYILVIQGENE